MDPLVGAALGGSFVTGLFNQSSANRSMRQSAAQAQIAREFSAQQAARQMRFQDKQSRTQYQRAVADMRKAGINPMLAAKLGGNAAMAGAMGQSFAGSGAQATMPDLGATFNSAMNLKQMAPLRKAQTAVQNALEVTEKAKPGEIQARIELIANQVKEISQKIRILNLDEREKRLLVTTLEAAKELDPEVYKNLKFGTAKTFIDGLLEAIINVENAVTELPDVVVELYDQYGGKMGKSTSGQMRRNK